VTVPLPEPQQTRVEVRAASALDRDTRAALEAWFREQFGATAFQWAEPEWYAMVRRGSAMIGRLGILAREIRVADAQVRVGGIAGVATRPKWRRHGVASLALRAAAEFIARELKLPFGLLLCRPAVSPVYAGLGWRRVEGPIRFRQPSGDAVYPGYIMVLELGDARWPAGAIDMCGLPW
jgi:GNAT superfamily N-acetyltransferase